MTFNIDNITLHYKVCALWSSELDEFTIDDISPSIAKSMEKSVHDFVINNEADLIDSQLPEEQIGHSLWLTQNRHGAGFFDFPMDKDVLTRLTNAAQAIGEKTLYAADNGEYITGC